MGAPVNFLDADGNGTGDACEAMVSSTVKIATEDFFQIAPNPAGEQIQLTWRSTEPEQIQLFIYDALGQLKMQQVLQNTQVGANTYELAIHNLESGLYYLVLSDGIQLETEKLIVQR
jgi:hypothetical protein